MREFGKIKRISLLIRIWRTLIKIIFNVEDSEFGGFRGHNSRMENRRRKSFFE
jgi:hypothetical protein